MEEQISEIPQQTQPIQSVPVEIKKKSSLPKIAILLIVILLLAGGVYAGMQLEKKKIKVWTEPPLIEVSPHPTEISDETANWKTYTNTKYGFSFKYPDSWYLDVSDPAGVIVENYNNDEAPGRSYQSSDGNLFKIEIVVDEKGISVDKWFAEQQNKVNPVTGEGKMEFLNVKKVEIDSKKGIFYEQAMGDLLVGSTVFEMPRGGLINFWGLLNYKGNKELYNKILSTFKFLD